MTYPLSSDDRAELLAEYRELGEQLSPDELRVLIHQARRMIRIGHGKYGPLDLSTERRDWSAEMASESSDRLFYEACREVAAEARRNVSFPSIAGSVPHSPCADPLDGDTYSLPQPVASFVVEDGEVTPLPPVPAVSRTQAMDFDTSEEE